MGAELRALRERTGLSLASVARSIQWNVSTLSRLERGQRRISPEAVMGLSVVYKVPAPQRNDLLNRVRAPAALGWWDRPPAGVPSELAALAPYEHHAVRITDWSPGIIPELLQTPAYAARVLRDCAVPDGDLQLRLRVHQQRQEVLDRRFVDYTAFLDASALRNDLCRPEDFRAQLQHLRKVSDLAGVVVRLVEAPTALASGGWYLMDFERAGSVVLLERLSSPMFLFDRDTEHHSRARAVLDELALSPRATQARLDALIGQRPDRYVPDQWSAEEVFPMA